MAEHRGFVKTLNKEGYILPSSPHPAEPDAFPPRALGTHMVSFLGKLERRNSKSRDRVTSKDSSEAPNGKGRYGELWA